MYIINIFIVKMYGILYSCKKYCFAFKEIFVIFECVNALFFCK